MRAVKLLSNGKILTVSNNDAHALIDSQRGELVVPSYSTKPMAAAGSVEISRLRRSSGQSRRRKKGSYLTK